MDPHSGRLYGSVEDAYRAGVDCPVEVKGRLEDIKTISADVDRAHRLEMAANRADRRKILREVRRNNDGTEKRHNEW